MGGFVGPGRRRGPGGCARENARREITRDEKAPGKPVVRVDLYYTQVTVAGLKELAALGSLTTLNLRFAQVTDAGLKELQKA